MHFLVIQNILIKRTFFLQQMSFERPDFTREFLAANPQVAYALFQAMLMMNIVDPNIITVRKLFLTISTIMRVTF